MDWVDRPSSVQGSPPYHSIMARPLVADPAARSHVGATRAAGDVVLIVTACAFGISGFVVGEDPWLQQFPKPSSLRIGRTPSSWVACASLVPPSLRESWSSVPCVVATEHCLRLVAS